MGCPLPPSTNVQKAQMEDKALEPVYQLREQENAALKGDLSGGFSPGIH